MPQYAAFLRAVNVAGHARVKMSTVHDAFVAAGGLDVATVIQSGNVLFHSATRDAKGIVAAAQSRLAQSLGETPDVMLRSARELTRLLETAPFCSRPVKASEKLYVVLLSSKPKTQARLPLASTTDALEMIQIRDREVFVVSGRKKNGFFGFPNQFVESAFNVRATSRNWTTINKIVAALRARESAT